jgi:hypothetical protein
MTTSILVRGSQDSRQPAGRDVKLGAVIRRKKRPARTRPDANASTTFACPHCGEQVDSWPDLGGGEHQTYIEDCPVCCRPNRITATLDESGRDFVLDVAPED